MGLSYHLSIRYQMLYTNLVKFGPVVLEKRMLTNSGHQLISIGHLRDSGDLKTE